MKKLVLLSVVASTMIMAGGDIAPVAAVAAPVAVSAWDFSGQAVVYYQTLDAYNASSLFDQASSDADAGIQLKAVNNDVFAGIGAGVAVDGLATLGLEHDVVSNVLQTANGGINGGWIAEGYLTYGMANTSLKLGRQTLPQSLSPFAYSENWNVFENTYDAALVVNTDLPDTTLVGAWVYRNNTNGYNRFGDVAHNFLKTAVGIHNTPANDMGMIGGTYADMAAFENTNGTDGVFMVTAQNKSIQDLTLTGSYYYGADFLGLGDSLNIIWGDAAYNGGTFNVAAQGGSVMDDALTDTTAFGAKIGATFAGVNAHIAYSTVDDGTTGIFNVGGQQTPLYTQMIINEGAIRTANDTVVVAANMSLLGGTIGAGYGMTSSDVANNDYNELDIYYTADVLESTNLLVGYVNMDNEFIADTNNVVRVVARYNF